MPEPLQSFFLSHKKEIIKYATRPDQRRYASADEGRKHFIDLDLYADTLSPVYKTYTDIIQLTGEEFVLKHGTGPWNIERQYRALVVAMTEKNTSKIIRIAGELGHYIADLHVPLHTTSNYDGQFSNQRGIHAFWETILVKHLLQQEQLFPLIPAAAFISDINRYIWKFTLESHSHLKKLFETDIALKKKYYHTKGFAMQNGKWQ